MAKQQVNACCSAAGPRPGRAARPCLACDSAPVTYSVRVSGSRSPSSVTWVWRGDQNVASWNPLSELVAPRLQLSEGRRLEGHGHGRESRRERAAHHAVHGPARSERAVHVPPAISSNMRPLGMMGQFVVVDNLAADVSIKSPLVDTSGKTPDSLDGRAVLRTRERAPSLWACRRASESSRRWFAGRGCVPRGRGSAWRRVPRSDGDFTWYSGLFGDNRPQPGAVVAVGGGTCCHLDQNQAVNHARCRCCSSSTPTLRPANALPPR